jgi:hypothetical protein
MSIRRARRMPPWQRAKLGELFGTTAHCTGVARDLTSSTISLLPDVSSSLRSTVLLRRMSSNEEHGSCNTLREQSIPLPHSFRKIQVAAKCLLHLPTLSRRAYFSYAHLPRADHRTCSNKASIYAYYHSPLLSRRYAPGARVLNDTSCMVYSSVSA